MATVTKRGAAYQLRVTHRLLPRPYYSTFDTEAEARSFGAHMERLLAAGRVPEDLRNDKSQTDVDRLLTQVIAAYCAGAPALTDSDAALLGVAMMDKPVVGLRLSGLSYRWLDGYVAWLKSPEKHLAPSSIRKRVGALGRAMDWHIRMTTAPDAAPLANVFRQLPVGYSAYSRVDAESAPARRDVQRDRRLAPDEARRVDAVLAGEKRADRERIYTDDAAFALLYQVIVDTGLRLFEAFRLRVDSIDLDKNIIRVDGSKGHRGQIKPRMVPIKKHLREPLRAWCAGRVGLLYPYWDGTEDGRRRATAKLSKRFAGLFEYAQVGDFTEHDLRHEATCRWFELRDEAGRYVFSDIEICRIMGWSDTRMALRYASLRGEDLSARLG
jgi:integrase